MLKSIVFACVLALAAPAAAQPTAASTPDAIAAAFFGSIRAGDVPKAYQDLWRGTLMTKKQADVENLTAQTQAIVNYFGKAEGYELMSEKAYSPSLLERTYLLRTTNGPVFFKLVFYKSPNGWLVYRLNFSDVLEKLA